MDDRTQIAALALAGINAGLWANNEIMMSPDDQAHDAVRCADALLARLAETASAEADFDHLEWDTATCTSFAEGHDREQAAQMGEPSPWALDADADKTWRNDRIAAVRAGLREVKIERLDPEPVQRPAPTPQPEADGVELSEAVRIAALKGFHKIYSGDGIVRNRDVLGACRAAIAADRAERPPIQPVQAIPMSQCPEEWRDGRWLLVCDEDGKWGVRYWHPGLEKWIGMRPQLPAAYATYVAPLPSTDPVPLVLPPGWVAVPRELTVDMWDADEASDRNNLEEVWEAILAAAPPCPGVKEEE